MKWKIVLPFFLLIFWVQLVAQKVDLTLRFNPSKANYEVFAKPDFTKEEFSLDSGSQVSVLIPSGFSDKPLIINSLMGGEWNDFNPLYAPKVFQNRDFHIFVSDGGTIDFQEGKAHLLFSFLLPINYDSKEVRLFANGLDPKAESVGIVDRSFNNCLLNSNAQSAVYRTNYGIKKDIKGHIKDWRGYPLEGVNVSIENEKSKSLYDGRFEFKDIAVSNDVTFKFDKEVAPLDGVSIADIIAIQQHLSGIQKFEHSYQWVAADLDGSGAVTEKDVEILQQIISNSNAQNSNKIGWRYIPTDWLKNGLLFKKSYGENIQLSYMERVLNIDFTAIKIGDVNGSYTVKDNIPTNILTPFKLLTINLLNVKMKAGKHYHIPFSFSQTTGLAGYQLAIKLDDVTIIEAINTFGSSDTLSHIQKRNGIVIANWFGTIGNATQKIDENNKISTGTHQSNSNLIQLEIIAKKNGLLSDFISIINQGIATEAYDENGQVMKIQLLFQKPPEEKRKFELYQNSPNPFNKMTSITYYLPNDCPVILTLTDGKGKKIKVVTEKGKKGFNSFILNGDELTKGLIYYKMETKYGDKVKKMLHLN